MTLELHDLTGLEKPLLKLIDCLQKGCSWYLKPIQIKRIAKAEAEDSRIRNVANFKNALTETLAERITSEMNVSRMTRQTNNIASIYSMAAQELQAIDNIDDTPIGNEWSAMFFDYAKDVDDEKIQIIWSKILAGEVAESGSFYKRTLSVLKNIEPFEAEWFVEACSLVFNDSLIDNELASEFIAYNKILSLMDCGLVNPVKSAIQILANAREISFKTYSIIMNDNVFLTDTYLGSGYTLTDAGSQLYKITQVQTNMDYVVRIKDNIGRLHNCESVLSISCKPQS